MTTDEMIVEHMRELMAATGAPFALVPLSPFFGRTVMESEVPDLVPLVYLDGGPMAGWVYDIRRVEKREPDGEGVTYEYGGDVGMLPDGRLVRIFDYHPPAPPRGGYAVTDESIQIRSVSIGLRGSEPCVYVLPEPVTLAPDEGVRIEVKGPNRTTVTIIPASDLRPEEATAQ